MIDFFVIVPFLFTIFVALMIGVSWVSFFRNLVDRNPQNRRRGPYSGGSRSWIERNRSASQRQRRNGRPSSVPAMQPTRETDRQLVETLLQQSPQDLLHILKQYLPERYHGEIAKIQTSGNWRKELRSFIRRSDIWPILRKALLTHPDAFQGGKKPSWDMSTFQGGEESQEELAKQLELEYNELKVEYDRLLESEFEEAEPIQVETAAALKSIQEQRQTAPAGSRMPLKDREWLRQAILGSAILKRPEY